MSSQQVISERRLFSFSEELQQAPRGEDTHDGREVLLLILNHLQQGIPGSSTLQQFKHVLDLKDLPITSSNLWFLHSDCFLWMHHNNKLAAQKRNMTLPPCFSEVGMDQEGWEGDVFVARVDKIRKMHPPTGGFWKPLTY